MVEPITRFDQIAWIAIMTLKTKYFSLHEDITLFLYFLNRDIDTDSDIYVILMFIISSYVHVASLGC